MSTVLINSSIDDSVQESGASIRASRRCGKLGNEHVLVIGNAREGVQECVSACVPVPAGYRRVQLYTLLYALIDP